MGNYGGIHDLQSFKQFVLTGFAGPGGRPLALASFLLDDNDWPSQPLPFKHTNILFHIVCGLLLLGFVRRVLEILRPRHGLNNWLAIIVAGYWLLHPLNVSTVLYVVQRMAILSTLFTLCGLYLYVAGRQRLADRPHSAVIMMYCGILGCSVFAVLCKETGALLPGLAWMLEWSILSRHCARPLPRRHAFILLALPNLFIALYFFNYVLAGKLVAGYAIRPFTLGERLLTEARVISEYLTYWFIPRSQMRGVFSDDFPISHSLTDPISTLPATIYIVALMAVGFAASRKYPLLALGLLFFFVGHVLESGPLPLELYFEHRNYLPTTLLILPICVFVTDHLHSTVLRRTVATLTLLIPAALTGWLSVLWGNSAELTLYWSRIHPESVRAQRSAAIEQTHVGNIMLAKDILDNAIERTPSNVELRLHRLLLDCNHGEVSQTSLKDAYNSIKQSDYDFRTFDLLRAFVELTGPGRCKGIGPADSLELLNILSKLRLASLPGAKRQISHLMGQVELQMGDTKRAAEIFLEAQKSRADPDLALLETALLGTYGAISEARAHLDLIEREAGKTSMMIDNMPLHLAIARLRLQLERAQSPSLTGNP